MRKVMGKLVSTNQAAFLEGRWIADNTIVAQEILHKIKRHNGKSGLMAMKIDLRKAYDSVEWGFLEAVMLALGFSSAFAKLILSCIETVKYSVIVNGNAVGRITPERGLRQGDPLSPYLFLLCAEVLSKIIKREEMMGRMHGVKVCRQAEPVSHLLYADDLLVFCRAKTREAEAFMQCFNMYCRWSGQCANVEKSHIYFSKHTLPTVKREIRGVTGFKNLQDGSVYLGNTFIFGRSKVKEFRRIKERVQAKVDGWQSRLLSKAGKVTLIKSVAQAIPTYSMATFKFPDKMCRELDSIVGRFWWGCKADSNRYLALKPWKELCMPKEAGGLGFRSFKDFNMALLAKLAWRLAAGYQSLWTVVLQAKYLKGKSFFQYKAQQGTSFVWRSILAARELVLQCALFSVGGGHTVNTWLDPWVPGEVHGRPVAKPGVDTKRWEQVSSLMDSETREWNEELIREVFEPHSASLILQTRKMAGASLDTLCWLGKDTGSFSVGSCYRQIILPRIRQDGFEWKRLWRAKIHDRLKVFLWRLFAGALPLATVMATRLQFGSPACCLCGVENETTLHLFLECPITKGLAFGSKWGFNLATWTCSSVQELFKACFFPSDISRSFERDGNLFLIFIACLFYTTWSMRNDWMHGQRTEMLIYVKRLNETVEEFMAFYRAAKVDWEFVASGGLSHRVPEGWFKVCTDATFVEDVAVLAVVVCDSRGAVHFCATKQTTATSSFMAELKAIDWASDMLLRKLSSYCVWVTDAKLVAEVLLSQVEPREWHSREIVLNCRHRFLEKKWELYWEPRRCIEAADRLAKISKSSGCDLYFNVEVTRFSSPWWLPLISSVSGSCLSL